jgi:outer membrane protein OmpA-like peptidoglycan-associated protein
MRHSLRVGGVALGLIVLGAGCATKEFVRQEVRQNVDRTEAQLGQRIGTVEGRVGAEAQRLDRESQRIGAVESGVTEQGQRLEGLTGRVGGVEAGVGEARGRADAAMAKAGQVDERLTRLWSRRHARTLVESLELQFAFDRATLSDAAQTALVNVVKELKQNPALSVDLHGYTDPVGSREYNLQLSQRRVDAVRRYLVEQGVDLPRINAIGLGPVSGTPAGGAAAAKHRKVTVNLMLAAE